MNLFDNIMNELEIYAKSKGVGDNLQSDMKKVFDYNCVGAVRLLKCLKELDCLFLENKVENDEYKVVLNCTVKADNEIIKEMKSYWERYSISEYQQLTCREKLKFLINAPEFFMKAIVSGNKKQAIIYNYLGLKLTKRDYIANVVEYQDLTKFNECEFTNNILIYKEFISSNENFFFEIPGDEENSLKYNEVAKDFFADDIVPFFEKLKLSVDNEFLNNLNYFFINFYDEYKWTLKDLFSVDVKLRDGCIDNVFVQKDEIGILQRIYDDVQEPFVDFFNEVIYENNLEHCLRQVTRLKFVLCSLNLSEEDLLLGKKMLKKLLKRKGINWDQKILSYWMKDEVFKSLEYKQKFESKRDEIIYSIKIEEEGYAIDVLEVVERKANTFEFSHEDLIRFCAVTMKNNFEEDICFNDFKMFFIKERVLVITEEDMKEDDVIKVITAINECERENIEETIRATLLSIKLNKNKKDKVNMLINKI